LFILVSFALKRGLTLFDPLLDSDDLQKKAQYTAYLASLSANTYIDVFDFSFNLSNSLYAQYSEDKLYGTELFSIGGLYTVRGFEYMGYAGEIGAYMRNDLSYLIYEELFGVNMAISPFVAYDLGFVEYDEDIYKYMLGGAVGVKVQTQYVSFDLGVSFPFYAYDPIAEEQAILSLSAVFNY
jgi:hemolysin activation/secretion protein